MSFSFSKTVASSNSFEHSHGFEVGIEASVTAKIPFIGETEITLSAS